MGGAEVCAGDLLWLARPLTPGVGRSALPWLGVSVVALKVLRVCSATGRIHLAGLGTTTISFATLQRRLRCGTLRLVRPTAGRRSPEGSEERSRT